jgi:hypothetical protein
MNARHLLCCLTAMLATQAAREACAGFTIVAQPGYTIASMGPDGQFFSTSNPALAPANVAMTGTAFGSGALVAPHTIANVNNGQYGNTNSWISGPSATPYIAVGLTRTYKLSNFAFGRDNGNTAGDCCGGQLTDRNLGTYTFQYTNVASPTASTTFTGNPNTGWTTIGTINYASADDAVVGGAFTPWFRNQWSMSYNGAPINATAFRINTPNDQIAIDEMEFNGAAALTLQATGTHNVANVVPNNLALASNGATAFAKDLIGGGAFAPTHTIANLNDGAYGNQDSWIGNSQNSFAGVKLAGPSIINSVAWGRDNGGEATAFADRTLGDYILQYTTVANPNELTPDSDWNTISVITYGAADPVSPSTRHLWGFDPVLATGIRLFVPGNGLGNGAAIDELEVFGAQLPEPASIAIWSLMGVAVLVTSSRFLRRKSA